VGNLIDLTKKARIVLEKKQLINVQANIILAVDKSGSMSYDFSHGVVQNVVDRLLAVGMNMDVDKSIDVYTFNNGGQYVGSANESNHKDFMNKNGVNVSGGTSYAPVMKMILAKYGTAVTPTAVSETVSHEVDDTGFLGKLFGKTKTKTVTETVTKMVAAGPVQRQDVPTIVFFITDGDNGDHDDTKWVLREASKQGVFWSFVGIGNERFNFLTELDKLTDRQVDNASFFNAKDIDSLSDEKLYEEILKEIPGWVQEAKAQGMIN
jgi:hypothetical protein